MSAVISMPMFGNRTAIRSAEVGNAAYNRAIKLGYGRASAQQFARLAKREAGDMESAAHVALRVVMPMRGTFAGPTSNNAA